MDRFIKDIKHDIKETFSNDDFEKERALIKQEFDAKRAELMTKLNETSAQYGFQVKSASNGIYMMPVLNGKTIEEEEFEKLDEQTKKDFEDKSSIVQQHVMEAISQIKAIQLESDKKISEWQSNVALLTVNAHINYIKQNFKRNKKINKFLDDIKKDILKNVNAFLVNDENSKQISQQPQRLEIQRPWLNYRVNLFIDNSNLEGAPVIMDSNYSYPNYLESLNMRIIMAV